MKKKGKKREEEDYREEVYQGRHELRQEDCCHRPVRMEGCRLHVRDEVCKEVVQLRVSLDRPNHRMTSFAERRLHGEGGERDSVLFRRGRRDRRTMCVRM